MNILLTMSSIAFIVNKSHHLKLQQLAHHTQVFGNSLKERKIKREQVYDTLCLYETCLPYCVIQNEIEIQ